MSAIIHSAFAPGRTEALVPRAWWGYLLWIPAAALLGFVIPVMFVGVLHLERSMYLIPYVALVSSFVYAFLHWSALSPKELLRHNWIWGVVGRCWWERFWSATSSRSRPRHGQPGSRSCSTCSGAGWSTV